MRSHAIDFTCSDREIFHVLYRTKSFTGVRVMCRNARASRKTPLSKHELDIQARRNVSAFVTIYRQGDAQPRFGIVACSSAVILLSHLSDWDADSDSPRAVVSYLHCRSILITFKRRPASKFVKHTASISSLFDVWTNKYYCYDGHYCYNGLYFYDGGEREIKDRGLSEPEPAERGDHSNTGRRTSEAILVSRDRCTPEGRGLTEDPRRHEDPTSQARSARHYQDA